MRMKQRSYRYPENPYVPTRGQSSSCRQHGIRAAGCFYSHAHKARNPIRKVRRFSEMTRYSSSCVLLLCALTIASLITASVVELDVAHADPEDRAEAKREFVGEVSSLRSEYTAERRGAGHSESGTVRAASARLETFTVRRRRTRKRGNTGRRTRTKGTRKKRANFRILKDDLRIRRKVTELLGQFASSGSDFCQFVYVGLGESYHVLAYAKVESTTTYQGPSTGGFVQIKNERWTYFILPKDVRISFTFPQTQFPFCIYSEKGRYKKENNVITFS